MTFSEERSDFLAYPLTGCYASSPFARSERLLVSLLAIEERLLRVPVIGRLLRALAWRMLIVARKPGGPGDG